MRYNLTPRKPTRFEKKNRVYYEAKFSASTLCSCSCDDSVRFCKHNFLLSHAFDVPYTLKIFVLASSAPVGTVG
ncbi:hypothetical protein BD408DRAFT_419187 [Parasitella parasitica]|nr:hypothetical protein BD408DRAFT_419187 [Parasitella parasitica]